MAEVVERMVHIDTNAIMDALFFSEPDPNAPKSGLAALIAD